MIELLLPFLQAVKYFLDPKTSQKVKFVYPKDKDSVELMGSFFDIDNLPGEFGGKATMKYDHEEFSQLMAQDMYYFLHVFFTLMFYMIGI